jgi:hypothetical protein
MPKSQTTEVAKCERRELLRSRGKGVKIFAV